jgi:hypothetical protein
MLMEAALAALHQPNTPNTQAVIRFLRLYSDDASARQSLLNLYLKWIERWSTHPERAAQGASSEPREDSELGIDLAYALLASQGWVPDESLKATVREHCIGKSLCDEVDRFSKPNLDVSVFDTSDFDTSSFAIGPFSSHSLKLFEAKIDQFPKGTTFHLLHDTNSNWQALQNKTEADMADLFAKHGMKLTIPER